MPLKSSFQGYDGIVRGRYVLLQARPVPRKKRKRLGIAGQYLRRLRSCCD